MSVSIRTFSDRAFCPRTYACDDRLGIVDVNKAISTFHYALQRGAPMKPGTGAGKVNIGTSISGPNSNALQNVPVHGHPSNTRHFATFQPTDFPLVVLEDAPNFAIQADLRLYDQLSYVDNSNSGNGWRSAVIRFSITNGAGHTQQLIHIYNDRSGFLSLVGAQVWDDPNISVNIGALQPFGSSIKLLTILGAFDSAFFVAGGRGAAWLQIHVDYYRYVDGAPWTAAQTGASIPSGIAGGYTLSKSFAVHPETQQVTDTDGVLSLAVHTFDDAPAAMLAAGATFDAATYGGLIDRAQRAAYVGYTGGAGNGYGFGGFLRPLIGQYGISFDEATPSPYTQTFTLGISIPPGVNRFEWLAFLRFSGDIGTNRNMSIQAVIRKAQAGAAAPQSQTVYLDDFFALGYPTGAQRVHETGTLLTGLIPADDVEFAQLILTVQVTNPRGIVPPQPVSSWAGIFSWLLRFYRE